MKSKFSSSAASFVASLTALLISLLLFPSCSRREQAPSVIVIAVDSLGVNELNCSRESKTVRHSGIDLLCEESVRFTHAFTTSVQSVPALTSVLTGLYPFESKVRTNKDSLSNTVETLPEWLQKNKYRTFFASGGAPVFRKTGLHQGFDFFDDNISPQPQQLFRSFSKSQDLFFSTMKELNSDPTFSLFYVPDLIFANTLTLNELGESRNLSFESQLEAFDESLYKFIQQLKKRSNWDSTVIMLVGLSGPGGSRPNEPAQLNLLRDRVQVGLLVKPSRKPRDRGIRWTIDTNISLADIAPTLKEWIGKETMSLAQAKPFPRISFSQGLLKASTPWDDNRLILIEAPWENEWRLSTRKEQWTFIYDEKPKIYNSLIDHMESTSASITESGSSEVVHTSVKELSAISAKPFSGGNPKSKQKSLTLPQIFSLTNLNKDRIPALKQLWQTNKNDAEVYALLITELLQKQNWRELKAVASAAKDTDAIEIALGALGEKKEDSLVFKDPCLKLFTKKDLSPAEKKSCGNNMIYELYDYVLLETTGADSADKEAARKKFLKSYALYVLDKKIYETDLALGRIWDLNRPRSFEVERVFALKVLQRLRAGLFR